jgi:MSHA pilin protein MshA
MKKINNEKGFTLIEIIAVLVILGILAAVAVPKFIDLQDDAKKKALEGALAEGMSTVSLAYAKLALSNGSTPGEAAVAAKATVNTPGGDDFSYTFSGTDGNGVVSVQVGAKTDGALDGYTGTESKDWHMPD